MIALLTEDVRRDSEIDGELLETFRQLAIRSNFEIEPRLDNAFLSRFLRVRRYNLEKALKSLQNYYRNIFKHRELVRDIEPAQLKGAFYSETAMCLKGLSLGRRVAVLRIGNWDTTKIPCKDLQVCTLYQAEYISLETSTQEQGVVAIIDLSGLTFAHICQSTPTEIKRNVNMIQDGLPLRFVSAHIVNPHYIMWPVLTLTLRLLKKKLRERVSVHYAMEELHKFIDPRILPKSLGGKLKEYEAFDVNLTKHILKENIRYRDFWTPVKPKTFTRSVRSNSVVDL